MQRPENSESHMRETLQNTPLPSWQHFRQEVVDLLPHVIGSLLVLVAGILLGVVVGRVARRLLSMTNVDRRAANVGVAGSLATFGVASTGRLLAGILQWFVIFSSTIAALYLLDSRLASDLAERFLLYVPQAAGASLIFLAGLVVAKFLSQSVLIAAVNRRVGPSRLLSDVTRVGVVVVSVAIALEQAQIGGTTVLLAFGILFGGVTLTAAIAIGFALREVVSRWLIEQVEAARSKQERDMFQHL